MLENFETKKDALKSLTFLLLGNAMSSCDGRNCYTYLATMQKARLSTHSTH